jgi:hypothetical protein
MLSVTMSSEIPFRTPLEVANGETGAQDDEINVDH